MKFNKYLKLIFIVFAILSASIKSYAKYVPYNELESWNSINLKYNFLKKFKLSYEGEARYELDYEKEKTYLNSLTFGYEFLNNVEVELSYRIKHKDLIPRNEYFVALNYAIDIRDFELDYRFMYQYKEKNYETYLRNKFKLEYDFSKKFSTSLYNETFYNFTNLEFGEFEESRTGIAIEYEFIKDFEFELGFVYLSEFNVKKPKLARLIKTGLTYSF